MKEYTPSSLLSSGSSSSAIFFSQISQRVVSFRHASEWQFLKLVMSIASRNMKKIDVTGINIETE